MTADPAVLVPGTRLAHYEVTGLIGTGAMGTVYAAHDTALDRSVAVKVIRPDLAGERGVTERFVSEARAAARVSHPRIAHVYFVGTHEGAPFYAMEQVPGVNLEDRVRRGGPLSLAQAIDVLVQAAEGLGAAHAAGIVHRDVKPSNLILQPDGAVKITDFGLAKSLRGDPTATHVGSLIGTPEYMSPEQCRGAPVDARSDVYALGLTGFFLLTGTTPYEALSIGALLDQQMNAPLPSVRDRRADLSPAVDRVLGRLCEKDAARRPATMREAIRLLEEIRPREVHGAPLVARATALGIDLLAFAVTFGGFTAGLSYLGSWAPSPEVRDLGLSLLAVGLAVASQLGLEWAFGASAGKMLFRLEVVREDGSRPRPAALAWRLLLRFPSLPFALIPEAASPAALGYVEAALQGGALLAGVVAYVATRGRTLSDVLTRTRVAYRLDGPGSGRRG